MNNKLAILLATTMLSTAPAIAQQPDYNSPEFESAVREYILSHPDVITEALQKAEQNRHEADRLKLSEGFQKYKNVLTDTNTTIFPSTGPNDAPVTIVEFFDFNCGVCKAQQPMLKEASANDNTRIVYAVFPFLTPTSQYKARAWLTGIRLGAPIKEITDDIYNTLPGENIDDMLIDKYHLDSTQYTHLITATDETQLERSFLDAVAALGANDFEAEYMSRTKQDRRPRNELFFGSILAQTDLPIERILNTMDVDPITKQLIRHSFMALSVGVSATPTLAIGDDIQARLRPADEIKTAILREKINNQRKLAAK